MPGDRLTYKFSRPPIPKKREAFIILDRLIRSLNRNMLMGIIFALILLLGLFDYTTGFELTFSFFYLIPVMIATWYLGDNEGVLFALICSFTWAASNRLAGQTYSHEIIRYWNTGIRLSIFLVVAKILGSQRTLLLREQTLSRTDFVTGIHNGREFYNRSDLEILNSRRFGHPLTVAAMDVDGFKQVNDTLGHQKGDELLWIIGQTMASTIRKTDFVARMGGDEFALLFPDTDQSGARFALGKIKDALTAKMNEMNYRVTFSFGAVTFLAPNELTDAILGKADQLMYAAKESGKNRIIQQTIG